MEVSFCTYVVVFEIDWSCLDCLSTIQIPIIDRHGFFVGLFQLEISSYLNQEI